MHACTHKFDEVDALMLNTSAHIKFVHNNFLEHAYMSGTITPNLVYMHVDMYINCKNHSIK